MNGSKSKSKRARDKANVSYFITLANTRASLERLPMMALLSVILLAMDTAMVAATAILEGYRELLPLFYAHLVLIGFSFLALGVAPIKALVFRFQTLFSSLMALFAAIWVYTLCFGGMAMVIHVQRPMNTILNLALLPAFAMVGLLYVSGAVAVHVLLLKKRLRDGHSEERTQGNLMAASSVYSSKSLWIIFGVVTIVPNLITQGQFLTQTVGVILFLLFASVVPGLLVEFTYLAYLKSRDKQYWERRPPKRVTTKQQKVATLKKVGKWTLIIVAIVVALEISTKIL